MIRCILILLLLFCGCDIKIPNNSYKPTDKVKFASEIRSKVAVQLNQHYGLVPRGTSGQMMDQIKKLGLMFDYPKPLTVDEARPLIVNAINEFIAAVNEDEQVRPYLANYPFTPKNIEITIILQDAQGRGSPDGDLLIIDAENGYIQYKMNDPITDTYRVILEESFEHAEYRLQQAALPAA